MSEYKLEQVSIRLNKEAPLLSRKKITSPLEAVGIVGRELLSQLDREALCIVNLKSSGEPINFSVVSIGSINSSLTVPREMLKTAVLSNAANVIVLHNHPSGSCTPSRDDISATNIIIKCFNSMGIGVLDHVIIGGNNTQNYYSMKVSRIVNFEQRYDTDRELRFNQLSVAEQSCVDEKKCVDEHNYSIEIVETLSRTINIKAPNITSAVSRVENLYNTGEIVLSGDDFLKKEIKCVSASENKSKNTKKPKTIKSAAKGR